MLAAEALAHLEALAGGRPVPPEVVDHLEQLGLAIVLDPVDQRRCADFRELEARHGLMNADTLKRLIDTLNNYLRSGMYRTIAPKASVAQRERDRSLARRMLPIVSDPDENARLQAALIAYAQTGPDRLEAPSATGRRLIPALRARLAQYGDQPLEAFLKPFRRSEARMESFRKDVAFLDSKVDGVRGKQDIIAGLLKSGLRADVAALRWSEAQRAGLPHDKPTEVPHLAVAAVRLSQDTDDVAATVARQKQVMARLVEAGIPPGPVQRGAARLVMASDDPEAVQRFVALYRAFNAEVGDLAECQRFAGRMLAVPGEPAALVARCVEASKALNRSRLTAASVALAANVTPESTLAAVIERFRAIGAALERAGAFHEVPDSIVDLVACRGTPAEVAAVVHQAVLHFEPRRGERWGYGEEFALAVAFAKRLMY